MITIVDYGLGNIAAFANLYRRLNIPVTIAKTADELKGADKIVLPGVGHFDHAMELLEGSGMRETLDALVLRERVPVLGICVGMQILARTSDEGKLPGLGWIKADVRWFKSIGGTNSMPLPHMGWNDVKPLMPSKLFSQLETEARFYFLHSYYIECDRDEDVLAVCNYGADFACAVHAGNIYGVQFHPEKSHRFGTCLLKNFAEL
jgi:glutamine amidotransferase